MRRRTFLTLGIAGTAAFAAAGWWTWLRTDRKATGGLDQDAARIVAAIVPAMLAGALPDSTPDRATAIDETVAGVERAISGLPPAARAELAQLFTLLALPTIRRMLADVDAPWEQAGVEEVNAFLERWRDSGWALKRSAYDALHQLTLAAWYGNPRSWAAIDYPGPPSIRP